jgi:hypothetical protein
MGNDGEVFELGQVRYQLSLNNIFKENKNDVEVVRVGEVGKIGYLSIEVDVLEKLDICYFIPPNCIID